MVGGQHHRIANFQRVEPGEEAAQRPVERVEMHAHLGAAIAVTMADDVGRRQANRQQVGRLAPAEPVLVDQLAANCSASGSNAGEARSRTGVGLGRIGPRCDLAVERWNSPDTLIPPKLMRPDHAPGSRPAGWSARVAAACGASV